MPTLPDVVDFGARPGLRTGRVDRPDTGRLAGAEALNQAAQTFANMAIDKRQKDDATEYATSKSDLLKEDMRLRRELEEGGDWENFDEAYRTGMNAARDRITPNIRTAEDQALFGADADLTVERGVTAMGEIGRRMEIDNRVAGLNSTLEGMRNDILEADPMTRNDMMDNVLDRIEALGPDGEGILTAVQAEATRQEFVSDVAAATVMNMDAPERVAALQASIAAGENPQDIMAGEGEGSGTMADFLPRDVKIRMLREAEDEAEIETNRSDARAAADAALVAFPDDIRAQRQAIRDAGLTAEALEISLRYAEEEQAAVQRAENANLIQLERDWTARITDGASPDNIPADEMRQMTAAQQNTLRGHYANIQLGRQFGEFTNYIGTDPATPSYQQWAEMTPNEKLNVPLDTASWMTNFTEADYRQMVAEQEALRNPTPSAGSTDLQIFQRTTFGGDDPMWPATGRDDTENEEYYRALGRFAQRVSEETAINNGVRPSEQRRQELLNEMLLDEAYLPRRFRRDITSPTITMTGEDLTRSYEVPFASFRNKPIADPQTGTTQTTEQYFRRLAASGGYQTTETRMARAYSAILQWKAGEREEPSATEIDGLLRGYGVEGQ